MTTHPKSRRLTRVFPYTSGQEGLWETLRPTAGDEAGRPHPLLTSLFTISHLQLSKTGDAVTEVSVFFHPKNTQEKELGMCQSSHITSFFLLKQAQWPDSGINDG